MSFDEALTMENTAAQSTLTGKCNYHLRGTAPLLPFIGSVYGRFNLIQLQAYDAHVIAEDRGKLPRYTQHVVVGIVCLLADLVTER